MKKTGNLLKRTFGILLIILMLIIIPLLYKIGYLPIVGKAIAGKKLSVYVDNTQMQINRPIKVKYDWYNNRYVCSNPSLSLSYHLQNNSIHDGIANQQVNDKLIEDYKEIAGQFPPNITLPEHVFIWSTINADDYNIKAQRLYILEVYNTESLSESESIRMPAKIATDFIGYLDETYNITGIQLIYGDKNGMYDIEIRADSFHALEYEKLLKSTKKRSENELPLSYYEWLESNWKEIIIID